MTINTNCIVQEGQIGDDKRAILAEKFNVIAQERFQQDATLNWIEIKSGNGWTAGEASTSSIVGLSVPDMDQPERTDLLTAVCDVWMEVTGCHINEIVANAVTSEIAASAAQVN